MRIASKQTTVLKTSQRDLSRSSLLIIFKDRPYSPYYPYYSY
jgi:hypothetical protein